MTMHQIPILTLPPPVLPPLRVVHLDKLAAELPYLAPHYSTPIVGQVELRGSSHPIPAVVVRRGTI